MGLVLSSTLFVTNKGESEDTNHLYFGQALCGYVKVAIPPLNDCEEAVRWIV